MVLLVQNKVECRKRSPTLKRTKLPTATPLQVETLFAVVVEVIAYWNAGVTAPSIFHFSRGQMTRPPCADVLSRRATDGGGVALGTSKRSGARAMDVMPKFGRENPAFFDVPIFFAD